jgi:hypothetical protein
MMSAAASPATDDELAGAVELVRSQSHKRVLACVCACVVEPQSVVWRAAGPEFGDTERACGWTARDWTAAAAATERTAL